MKKLCFYTKIVYGFIKKYKKFTRMGIDVSAWIEKFVRLYESQDIRCTELLTEFLNCQMEKVSHSRVVRKNKYAPILFCVIKNDVDRIANFVKHYRTLGVEVFVFLDNASTDGTREFLCEQPDAIVYSSKQTYSSVRRVAWLNRLLAIYGNNKWCLIVDSDEFLTYIGSETYKISDVVKEAIRQGYCRIEGFLLDMYSQEVLFRGMESKSEATYFDMDSYTVHGERQGAVIKGGPRKRVLKTDVVLSKYPLFFFRKQDFVASAHYLIPYEPIKECPIWIAICHYKFVGEKDFEKIKIAVQNENYANGSADYKKYLSQIEKNDKMIFYESTVSVKLEKTEDLRKIKFLSSPFDMRKEHL